MPSHSLNLTLVPGACRRRRRLERQPPTPHLRRRLGYPTPNLTLNPTLRLTSAVDALRLLVEAARAQGAPASESAELIAAEEALAAATA